MKHMHKLWILPATVLLPGFADDEEIYRLNCNPPDNLEWVAGNEECLKIRTLNGRVSVPDPVLVVFLHGDVSRGGPANYLLERAIWFERPDVVPVVLIRPGYYDDENNKSTGNDHGRRDNYTPRNVDAIADAVKNLKARHGARRTVLVGHSGGAAIAGVILGRHPGVANAAVLAACPCNIDAWRNMRGGQGWSSLSPHSYAGRVPKPTEVIALTGADDSTTASTFARGYIETLTRHGVPARFALVAETSHNEIVLTRAFFDAVQELID